jgi:hypothetical protein
MTFITEKEELKPGLILFRRGDVGHRMWYCRMKMPKADRYKTVSLKTTDISAARERAFDQDADIRFRIKHDVPVFNRPFREVAREYLLTQEARAKRGEISAARPKKLRAVIEGTLDRYAGSTQVHLIGDERWGSYPAWRRENGAGRHTRNGVREVTADVAQSFANHESARRTKVQHTRGIRVLKPIAVKPKDVHAVPFISDSTIRFEMSIFGAIMNYAVKKRYVPASQRFDERPKLKTMRRDEFTLEEYRKLHTVGRKWIAEADKPSSVWYRTVTYNMILSEVVRALCERRSRRTCIFLCLFSSTRHKRLMKFRAQNQTRPFSFGIKRGGFSPTKNTRGRRGALAPDLPSQRHRDRLTSSNCPVTPWSVTQKIIIHPV